MNKNIATFPSSFQAVGLSDDIANGDTLAGMSILAASTLPALTRPNYYVSQDARIQYVRQAEGWRLRAGTEANAEDVSALFKLNKIGCRFPTRGAAHRVLASAYIYQAPPVSTVRFAGYYHIKHSPYTVRRRDNGWVIQSDDVLKSAQGAAFEGVFGAGLGAVMFPTRRAALEALTAWRVTYIISISL